MIVLNHLMFIYHSREHMCDITIKKIQLKTYTKERIPTFAIDMASETLFHVETSARSLVYIYKR